MSVPERAPVDEDLRGELIALIEKNPYQSPRELTDTLLDTFNIAKPVSRALSPALGSVPVIGEIWAARRNGDTYRITNVIHSVPNKAEVHVSLRPEYMDRTTDYNNGSHLMTMGVLREHYKFVSAPAACTLAVHNCPFTPTEPRSIRTDFWES